MNTLNDIRSAFTGFFLKHGHQGVPSSPLVPRNDPTLMFTNAGMVQFKDVFTGLEALPFRRAVSAQKCVRAGGKHNDLDNVGFTARHHTFFEMLGNFSFGDYFKDVAIELAWTLVTKEFGLDPKRLLVTVFSGDEEAFTLWKKIAALPDAQIIRIATSDNFWSMGGLGPCGPCSEIFYDHGSQVSGGPPGSAEQDGDRFVEIWNLVFMQYEQVSKTERQPLPHPSIDTGMGLERMAAVLQGVHNNYETDLFRSLIAASVEATRVGAAGPALPSHRIIADHLRASSFLIADGVLPSNEGRGYVLRRIMRRAMRHGHLLGMEEPLLYRLLPTLVREMGQAYPELVRGQALIAETLKLEEAGFRKTLERGLGLLDEAAAGLSSGQVFPGDIAFKLYDTYGFPLDLTEDVLKTRQIAVDKPAFQAAMARQKAEARNAWAGSGDAATEKLWFDLLDEFGPTEFLGYDADASGGEILALIRNGKRTKQLKKGEEGFIIVNQTPFYGESGGQAGDVGHILRGKSCIFNVTGTHKKLGKTIVHGGVVETGTFRVADIVQLSIDRHRRSAIRANHSSTHLLHRALRDELGGHVAQKGSLVAPDRLRFDISHPKPLTADEIIAVENAVNAQILENTPVTTTLMSVGDAMETGATALFGEKYGEEVRVVAMGTEVSGQTYSVELCGGTHVRATGEIGIVKIIQESAVSAGVRRLEAVSGAAARLYLTASNDSLKAIASLLRVRDDEALKKISQLMDERKKLERELTETKQKLALTSVTGHGASGVESVASTVGDVRLVRRVVNGIAMKDLRSLVDDAKRQMGSGIVAIVGVSDEGKAGLIVGVTEDLTGRYSAVDLVRAGALALGGQGGGGRADLAQAGAADASLAEAALDAISAVVERHVSH